MSLSLFFAQHVSNASTFIFRSLRLCVGILLWFDVCWRYGVVSLCRPKQCFSLHKDTTPPQPNHTVTPTHIEPEQYNTWDKSKISRKLLKMNVLVFETCWAKNKGSDISWSIFIQVLVLYLRIDNQVKIYVIIIAIAVCNHRVLWRQSVAYVAELLWFSSVVTWRLLIYWLPYILMFWL